MSFNELSKIFKADCLLIPTNWLVVSQPVIVWKASSDFLFSSGNEILWTGMYRSGYTGDHPNFLTEIFSVRQKEGENTWITAQHVNLLITSNSQLSSVEYNSCVCFLMVRRQPLQTLSGRIG